MTIVVIEHIHDEAAGVYRLTVGAPRLADDKVVAFEDVRDLVWADDDERWFDGERRAAEDVAAEQRAIAAELLAPATDEDAEEPEEPTPLPGVGEAL